MKIENLKPNSRLWIYQSDRFISQEECNQIEAAGNVFIENWSAHGSALEAALEVRYNCFVLLAVDEQVANATGCSIDKSVHFISDLGSKLNIDFFNRLKLVVDVNGVMEILSVNELEEKVNSGVVQSSSSTFNNNISELADLQSFWKIPLSESWVARQLALT